MQSDAVPAETPRVLRDQQLCFADWLRNPEQHTLPDNVTLQRMQVYRRLFINNISGLLASFFSGLRSVLSADAWQALVHDFYACHKSQTPLFPAIASEFIEYLCNERCGETDPPWLLELARYEWVQIFLQNSEDELPALDKETSVSSRKPMLSPLCIPLLCYYPVHQMSAAFMPIAASEVPTHLLVYRNREDQVNVIESDAATFRMLHALQDNGVTSVDELVAWLASEMGYASAEAIREHVQETLRQLLEWDVLLPQGQLLV